VLEGDFACNRTFLKTKEEGLKGNLRFPLLAANREHQPIHKVCDQIHQRGTKYGNIKSKALTSSNTRDNTGNNRDNKQEE
jgi:hypothetical protein